LIEAGVLLEGERTTARDSGERLELVVDVQLGEREKNRKKNYNYNPKILFIFL
jgi:hypothetical protein